MTFPNFQLPNQKEWGAGIGGILAFLAIAALQYFHVSFGAQGDASIDGALLVFFPWFVAKLTPASDQDTLKSVNDTIAQAGTIIGKLTPASDSTAPVTPAAASLAAKAN